MIFQIIQCRESEMDAVAPLFDAYRQFYKQKSDIAGAKDFLQTRCARRESVVFAAMENGNALGFVQLYPLFSSVSMERLWLLNDLYVTASARKKGVGEALIKKAQELATISDAKGLSLETGQDNRIAQALYVKAGFVKDDNFIYSWRVKHA